MTNSSNLAPAQIILLDTMHYADDNHRLQYSRSLCNHFLTAHVWTMIRHLTIPYNKYYGFYIHFNIVYNFLIMFVHKPILLINFRSICLVYDYSGVFALLLILHLYSLSSSIGVRTRNLSYLVFKSIC